MPKDTFFNLSEDKRNKIIDAAKAEFTEHQLYKARVSNIIKNADIPRGSFYQYFEDLEDLYYYVIDEFFDKLFLKGQSFSDDVQDLFEFSIYTFGYDYDEYTNDKRHRFIMNILKSISENEEYVNLFKQRRDDYIVNLLQKLDMSSIRFTKEDDLIRMYQMIQDVKRNVIQKSLLDNLTKEEAIQEVIWYMDVLKNGLLKGE
jgi:AcrR family transcriptional regulator